MSQANAAPVGTKELINWFQVNTNIDSLGLDGFDDESPYYDGTSANHSFQFHHDAVATWDFWEHIKNETIFDTTN